MSQGVYGEYTEIIVVFYIAMKPITTTHILPQLAILSVNSLTALWSKLLAFDICIFKCSTLLNPFYGLIFVSMIDAIGVRCYLLCHRLMNGVL